MFSERPVRGGVASLMAVILVCVLVTRFCRPEPVRIVRYDVVTSDSATGFDGSVRVNADGPRRLRKAGFSYYHISQIMYLRTFGCAFRSAEDLLALPYADSAFVASIAPDIDFSCPDTCLSLSEVSYLLLEKWKGRDSWRHYDDKEPGRPSRLYFPRIPLFAADSATLAEAGMSAASWDTLAAYQRSFILHGSMPLDSLVSLSPRALAEALLSRSTPRGGFTPAAVDVKTYDVVDLNSATREQLEAMPGVGAKTAEAILDFRRRLGGYVSVRQLRGLWPVTDERYEKLRDYFVVAPGGAVPVNVNAPNDTRLRRHPYFPPLLAARIGQMRLRADGRKLSREDVEKCADGVELSEFFWDYVAY